MLFSHLAFLHHWSTLRAGDRRQPLPPDGRRLFVQLMTTALNGQRGGMPGRQTSHFLLCTVRSLRSALCCSLIWATIIPISGHIYASCTVLLRSFLFSLRLVPSLWEHDDRAAGREEYIREEHSPNLELVWWLFCREASQSYLFVFAYMHACICIENAYAVLTIAGGLALQQMIYLWLAGF